MNNGLLSYRLQTFNGLISHNWQSIGLLCDGAAGRVEEVDPVDVQVRSGDYFITLATTLDRLGKTARDHHVRVELEDVVSDLIHLQDNYTINSKNKPSE